jgi:hypothetical protein
LKRYPRFLESLNDGNAKRLGFNVKPYPRDEAIDDPAGDEIKNPKPLNARNVSPASLESNTMKVENREDWETIEVEGKDDSGDKVEEKADKGTEKEKRKKTSGTLKKSSSVSDFLEMLKGLTKSRN